jgi:hypothetical protein
MSKSLQILTFTLAGVFTGCGGGGGDDPEVGIDPPPPAQTLALSTSNYDAALGNALVTSNIGFQFAKLGGEVSSRMLDQPINLFPNLPCVAGGAVSFELTDRNRNGAFNEHDTLHIRLAQCHTGATVTLDGLIRIELRELAVTPDGREFDLFVEVIGLGIATTNAPTRTVNFSGTVHFSEGATREQCILNFGWLDLREGDLTRSASNLVVDHFQDFQQSSYEYLVQGDLQTSGLTGFVHVSTPEIFSGTIGQYPSAGRLVLSGAANSSARASEEGADAGNASTVQISVDTNGDSIAEATVIGAAWSSLMPAEAFTSLRDQVGAVALPFP